MKRLRVLNLLLAACLPAAAQNTATIDIDTIKTIPVNPGFGGVNDEVGTPIEFFDYRFNAMAARLNYGWVRFPGGVTGDAYNWRTGFEEPAWVAKFSNKLAADVLPMSETWLQGLGGKLFIDAANRVAMLGGTGLIVSLNGFTDSPESIGQMAAYAKANGIPVLVWEMCNEPYNISEMFPTATVYLNKMKAYRDAIKAADPQAVVAIVADDPERSANPNPPWDRAITAYADKYWDAVSYHQYPQHSTGSDISKWMADENAILDTRTDAFVTGHLAQMNNPPGTKYLVTEFEPSLGSSAGLSADSLTNGSLYGGIYVAEYAMRMSTLPQVLHVGPHAIATFSGVMVNDYYYAQVRAAADSGTTIDTSTLDHGYYYAAQALGLVVAYNSINHAVKSNKTTVSGGATVPATGMSPIPALYAMSYANAIGDVSLVITNKSALAHQVTIRVDGKVAAGPFATEFISGADPGAMNTHARPSLIGMQTGRSANPVTVPPYSVMHIDVVAQPVATFANAASFKHGPVAPSEQVIAFGPGFAAQSIAAQVDPPPPMLGDTSITVTDSAGTPWQVPLYNVTSSSATFLLPDGVAAGEAKVVVTRNGVRVLTGTLEVASSAPGIFTANANGAGVAAATATLTAADGTVSAVQVYSCQDGVPLSCLETPLSLGDGTGTFTLTLTATGLRWAQSFVAYVAGQQVPVQDFGPQSVSGLDQVDITLPASLAGSGEVSLYLVADGNMSNVASLKVQ